MPQPTAHKKPILLVFPIALISNYKRCLIIANHLKDLFDIRFLHSDKMAPLVYQQGYDTFSKTSFSWPSEDSNIISLEPSDAIIEFQFLDLVEILETFQPLLVINDGINTLNMAAEFTGIPIIAILNGYMSPYYAYYQTPDNGSIITESFKVVRQKYGLKEKNSLQSEVEGDLNWICDPSDFFPQRELPENYITIGPIFELSHPSSFSNQDFLNPFKKTIFIDLDSIEQAHYLDELTSICNRNYNLVINSSYKQTTLNKRINFSKVNYPAQHLANADLVLTNSESTIYKALFYGTQVLFLNASEQNKYMIGALKDWNLGTCWNKNISLDEIEYRISLKQSDIHRILHYRINKTISTLGYKLRYSLSIGFPFIKKAITHIK